MLKNVLTDPMLALYCFRYLYFKKYLKVFFKVQILQKNVVKSDENSLFKSLDLLATTAGQRHLNVICNCKIAPFA